MSEQEIKVIYESWVEKGNAWVDIANLLEKRGDNSVKNTFNASLRKFARKVSRMLKFKQLKGCISTDIIINVQFSDLKVLLLRGVTNYDLLSTLHKIDESAEIGRLWSVVSDSSLTLLDMCPKHLDDLTPTQKITFVLIDFIN